MARSPCRHADRIQRLLSAPVARKPLRSGTACVHAACGQWRVCGFGGLFVAAGEVYAGDGVYLIEILMQHTKFEATAEGNFYTPHTYIGLAVSALLLGRVAYWFLAVYASM